MISSAKKTRLIGVPLYQLPFHHVTKGKFIPKIHVADSQSIQNNPLPAQIQEGQTPIPCHLGTPKEYADLNEISPDKHSKSNVSTTITIPVENECDGGGWSEDDLDLSDSASPHTSNITSALSLKILAEQFSLDVREKRKDQEVKSFIAKRSLDASSFESDERYRYLSFLKSGQTLDILDWNELMLVSSYFQVDKVHVYSFQIIIDLDSAHGNIPSK